MSPAGRALPAAVWGTSKSLAAVNDGICSITTHTRGNKPSLLDTLKAAAQHAAQQAVPQQPSAAEAVAVQAMPAEPCTAAASNVDDSEAGGRTRSAGPQAAAKPGQSGRKVGLQPIPLKRASGRGQKAGGCATEPPPSPVSACAAAAVVRFTHKARMELARLEIDIPWEAVHKSWRTQRSQWRKTLKQAEALEDLLGAMRELRDALSIPGSPFSNYGGSWDQLLQRCCSGGASLAEAGQLLSELKANAKAWIHVREQDLQPVSHEQKKLAMRGLEALWAAAQFGGTAVAQCPLEAIVDYDESALQALREILTREINLKSTSAAMGGESQSTGPLVGSVFTMLLERPSPVDACHQSRNLGLSTSEELASDALLAT